MEPITKQQIKQSKIFSPGIIGGETVYFLPTSNHCFFMKHSEEGEYVRDNGGKYAKLDIDAVIEARLLYLSGNLEAEKATAVEEMEAEINFQLQVEAAAIVNKIVDYNSWKNGDYSSMGDLDTIYGSAHAPTVLSDNKRAAIDFLNEYPNSNEIRQNLHTLVAQSNYKQLYIFIGFSMGKIAVSFKPGLLIDIKAYKQLLLNISNNHNEDIEKYGSISAIARAVVENQYHPEI